VRVLGGLDTKVGDGDVLNILPAMAGGSAWFVRTAHVVSRFR